MTTHQSDTGSDGAVTIVSRGYIRMTTHQSVTMSSANGLVGIRFASWYRLQPKVDFVKALV